MGEEAFNDISSNRNEQEAFMALGSLLEPWVGPAYGKSVEGGNRKKVRRYAKGSGVDENGKALNLNLRSRKDNKNSTGGVFLQWKPSLRANAATGTPGTDFYFFVSVPPKETFATNVLLRFAILNHILA